jgi:hypothetical protein
MMDEKELLEKYVAAIREIGIAAKGSIRQFKRNCGKASCKKCASGERHLSHQMTYYKEGKQHSRFVGPTQLEAMRQAIVNGRKVEELLVQFGLEYLDLLKGVKREK